MIVPVTTLAGRNRDAGVPVPRSSLASKHPKEFKEAGGGGSGRRDPQGQGSRGKKEGARRDSGRSISPGPDRASIAMDGNGTIRSVNRDSPPLIQVSARHSGRSKGSEEGTEFMVDGVDESALTFEELVQRCRRLKASDARNHAEMRRLQRELHGALFSRAAT